MFHHKIQNRLQKIPPLLRNRPEIMQFAKYVMIGLSIALLEYVLFTLLSGILPLAATNIIAMTTAATAGFLLNGRFAFRQATNVLRSAALYAILFVLNLTFSTWAITFLTHSVGMLEWLAKLITMPCIVIWNFILYRKIIFI